MVQNVVFLLGSALQTGAQSEGKYRSYLYQHWHRLTEIAYQFAGRVIAGFSIGALTHVVPMYIAEVSSRDH